MMSGVIGWVNASEVEVIDLSQAAVVSGYEVENGRLLHGIVYTMATPGYRTKLDNGPAPSYLSAGTQILQLRRTLFLHRLCSDDH